MHDRNARRSGAFAALLGFMIVGLGLSCSKKEPSPSVGARDAVAPASPQATPEAPVGEEPSAAPVQEASAIESLPSSVPQDALIRTAITPGVKGGKLVIGMPGDPKTFNPLYTDDSESSKVESYLYVSLYDYDAFTQQDTPGASKSWEYNDQTREWTFHLRDGMKWSDGHPLTSTDFLFFTECVFDETTHCTVEQFLESSGERFEFSAPDPLTFIAKIPDVDSFAILNLGLIRSMPRHVLEDALEAGRMSEALGTDTAPADLVTCGPFKLKEFRSGDRVVLEANPYFFMFDVKGTRLPYLDELVILNVPDYDALALRFQSGELDLIENLQAANVTILEDAQEEGNFTLHDIGLSLRNNNYWFNLKPGGSYMNDDGERVKWDPPTPEATPPPQIQAQSFRYFVNPAKRKWFENKKFRQACSMATNRESMVRTILFGEGEPIYGLTSPANKQWFNPDIPKFPYDLAKAARTLDGIGITDRDGDGIREDGDGVRIEFTIVTNKENKVRDKVGVMLKEDMRKIGFDVTLQLLDFNDIVTRITDSFDYEACILGTSSGVPPHPAMGANVIRSSGRSHVWNPSQKTPATPWEARIDELYGSLKQTFDEKEQIKIYDEIQTIWAENLGKIHLFGDTLYVAASNRIGNLKPTPLYPYITHNIQELYIKP